MNVALITPLFVAVPTIYYLFFTVMKLAIPSIIVWIAWKWRDPESIHYNVNLAEGQNI